ncbi:uncharacterized protein TRAVEDRAFT_26750 [Trametes versicolor FP-101664 SS1]|uniref:uncharacterized protein n=1 Tax=Trametes versicolor (strain FP-101664) TaxID=717944 RepID=UPI0004622E6C|nr:uncharacterized protein TRAVEDRAFT_26750 [Trametes versicolor FP-101664 SS1]EIW63501.1 hypothetical protein TRAVEDRAFT_26750 [Trametes versicolor FP-101664 SS1]
MPATTAKPGRRTESQRTIDAILEAKTYASETAAPAIASAKVCLPVGCPAAMGSMYEIHFHGRSAEFSWVYRTHSMITFIAHAADRISYVQAFSDPVWIGSLVNHMCSCLGWGEDDK